MKRILIIIIILSGLNSAYSQDCLDRVARQAVIIDSLQKVINETNNQLTNLTTKEHTIQKTLSDTINFLRSDLLKLEKFKSQKKIIDDELKTKSDSIALLKTQLINKDRQIATTKQEGEQNAKHEFHRGKAESSTKFANTYRKPFDDLIRSSTKESVQRDIHLIENNPEAILILNDLLIYFKILELLENRFNIEQIKSAQIELNQIKQNSELLDRLKARINNYQIFNEGLKETLNKLITLDKRESVSGMGDEIQKMKLNKIIFELSSYIFNYDFNFTDYPYLSDIILEILKRKQPNADSDVTDLLKKL